MSDRGNKRTPPAAPVQVDPPSSAGTTVPGRPGGGALDPVCTKSSGGSPERSDRGSEALGSAPPDSAPRGPLEGPHSDPNHLEAWGGWHRTRLRPAAREWAEGWDRGDRCPKGIPWKRAPVTRNFGGVVIHTPGVVAAEGGFNRGERWQELHRKRRLVVETLRRAGYVQRWRWAREERETRRYPTTYTEGPALGQPAVDAWEMAEKLRSCAHGWYHQLRMGAELRLSDAPITCTQRHVCPACAATRSAKLAAALRLVVLDGLDGGGPLALMTTTQRAHPDETLLEALERWRRAWGLMTGGGRRWSDIRERVAGWYYGIEVTRGDGATRTQLGPWWHLHAHFVVSVQPDADPDEARVMLAELWADKSARAAAERGLEGYGWDPAATGNPGPRYLGPWWEPIDREDPVQVYQAAKYATPVTTLHPAAMAEFLAVAHRRVWGCGGGSMRSVVRLAEEMPDERVAELLGTSTLDSIVPRPFLGEVVSTCGPGHSPRRGEVTEAEDRAMPEWRLRWGLVADVPEALARAVVELGGAIVQRSEPIGPRDHETGKVPLGSRAWACLPARKVLHHATRSEAELRAWAGFRDRAARILDPKHSDGAAELRALRADMRACPWAAAWAPGGPQDGSEGEG